MDKKAHLDISFCYAEETNYRDGILNDLTIICSDNNYIALASSKKLEKDELQYVCLKLQKKALIVKNFSEITHTYYYVFLGYHYISTVIVNSKYRDKLHRIVEVEIVKDKFLKKILESEFGYYESASFNVKEIAIKIWVNQCVLFILSKTEKIVNFYNKKIDWHTQKSLIKLEEFIVANINLPSPTIEEMANIVGVSVSKFKQIFFEVYHTTPHQYIMNLKLRKAVQNIHFTSLSVSEVSYKMGFTHPAGFSRFIKSKLGVSPLRLNNKPDL
jgi:AraC-like DNA-binding protein